MPQLDKVTFVSQLFWLFLCFFILFIVLREFILPLLFKNLKLRNHITSRAYSSMLSNEDGKIVNDLGRTLLPKHIKIIYGSLVRARSAFNASLHNFTKDNFDVGSNNAYKAYVNFIVNYRIKSKLLSKF